MKNKRFFELNHARNICTYAKVVKRRNKNRHYLSQITEKQNYNIVAYLTFLNN